MMKLNIVKRQRTACTFVKQYILVEVKTNTFSRNSDEIVRTYLKEKC